MSPTPSPGWKPPKWLPLVWGDLPTIADYVADQIKKTIQAAVRAATSNIDARIVGIEQNIDLLGEFMSKITEALADLDDATNAVAARLDALAGQVAASDQSAADQIKVEADRLRTLAADPNNPVPEPVPPVDQPPV